MSYYIGTKDQCDYYNKKVSIGENYNGTTQVWDIPSEVKEGVYTIVKHDKYSHSKMELIETLPVEFLPPNLEI